MSQSINAKTPSRLKHPARQVLTLADFTEADIVALKATRSLEAAKDFDHELTA